MPTPQPKLSALSVGTQGTSTKYRIYHSRSKLSAMRLSPTWLQTALGQGLLVFHIFVSLAPATVSGRLLTLNICSFNRTQLNLCGYYAYFAGSATRLPYIPCSESQLRSSWFRVFQNCRFLCLIIFAIPVYHMGYFLKILFLYARLHLSQINLF